MLVVVEDVGVPQIDRAVNCGVQATSWRPTSNSTTRSRLPAQLDCIRAVLVGTVPIAEEELVREGDVVCGEDEGGHYNIRVGR